MNVVRRFGAIIVVSLLLTIVSTATAKYSGGMGEPNNPYQIATAADLIVLGNESNDYDKHFIMTADIDLAGYVFDKAVIAPDTNPNTGSYFDGTPFTGVFDGNNHTISHMTVVGKNYVGLFGQLVLWDVPGCEVRNLGIVDVNIIGSGDYIGGLVGSNSGTVTQCYSTGSVNGIGSVGGLVGSNDFGGTVTMCYSTGTVSGNDSVGGLVGYNGGTVTKCYSTCAVSGNSNVGGLIAQNAGIITDSYAIGDVTGLNFIGGLVGTNGEHYEGGEFWEAWDVSGIISNCYSTGTVSGSTKVGGLVGYNLSGLVADCLWDTQTSGQATSEGGLGLMTAEMQDPNTFMTAGWDFICEMKDGTSQVWQMPEGGGYPVLAIFNGYIPPQLQGNGTSEDPYLISNSIELGSMIYYSPYAHYRLVSSIDLSGICWGKAVVPSFEGTFDGNSLVISHLTITGCGYLGLFGVLGKCDMTVCEVRNLGIVDVNIIGSGDYIGGLVGYNGSIVTECYSSGTVSGKYEVGGLVGANHGAVNQCYSTGAVSGNDNVGGLVGYNHYYGSTVTQCYSTGTVSGNNYVGGLVGFNDHSVTNCYTSGPVSGDWRVGGLVGENQGTVTKCYSTGAVSGNGAVGGLIGGNSYHCYLGFMRYYCYFGVISNCYSLGPVSGDWRVGGLVGDNDYGSSVIQCYSTGAVNGRSNVGGLIGYNYKGSVTQCYCTGKVIGTGNYTGGLVGFNNSGIVTASFWDTQTSGQATSGGGIGKTTSEMKTESTFTDADWDFVGETANGTEDIWWIDEGKDYPKLWWELPPEK